MAEGYAEMFDQFVYAGRSSWFLTANDDAGGGTFQVIEALKDRIDVVVRAVPFNSRFLEPLLDAPRGRQSPEELVPSEIVFTPGELEAIYARDPGAWRCPTAVLERARLLPGPARLLPHGLAAVRVQEQGHAATGRPERSARSAPSTARSTRRCTSAPRPRTASRCARTRRRCTSPRRWPTSAATARSSRRTCAQIVPWVLHEKLVPNARSPFFEREGQRALLQDRVAWIRDMFDMAHRAVPAPRAAARARSARSASASTPAWPGVDLKTDREAASGQVTALMEQLTTKARALGPGLRGPDPPEVDLQPLPELRRLAEVEPATGMTSTSSKKRRAARFVRWDARLWREIVEGPAAGAADGADEPGGERGARRPTCAWRARASGSATCSRRRRGREGFMTLAFLELVPQLLAVPPSGRRTRSWRALWNLGENLESAAVWLRRIFLRLFAAIARLDDLEALRRRRLEPQALAPPAAPLGARRAAVWIGLGAEDRRFLPGAVHFVAPTVVCVHDRSRAGCEPGRLAGRAAARARPDGLQRGRGGHARLVGAARCPADPRRARPRGTSGAARPRSSPRSCRRSLP